MLKEYDFEVCSLKDEDINIDVVEDGNTFEENALKKASEIYNYLLANNKGDAFVFVDDNRCGHLYVYDGFNTIFEMSVLRSVNRL